MSGKTHTQKDSLKVVHVLLSMDCGGMEQVVLDLARAGGGLGQQVDVVCLERPGQLASQLERLNIRVHCVYKPAGIQLKVRKQLRSLFASLRPNVVHVHQIGALFYAGPPARQTRVPVTVFTDHGEAYGKGWRALWLGRIAGRHARRYFCVSDEVAKETKARSIVPSKRIDVVPNGIDTNRFGRITDSGNLRRELGIDGNAPMIGTVGRLADIKCHDVLIHGFAQIKREFPAARLLIVGDGPLLPELRRLADRLSVAKSVHFVGYREDRERYLQIMDVFALTSRSEGLPLAVLEAWSAGVPVIASNVGGLPTLIEHGRNGLLYSRGDMESFTEGLRELLSNSRYSRQLAANGRETAITTFDVKTMAYNYHQRYLDLLDNN